MTGATPLIITIPSQCGPGRLLLVFPAGQLGQVTFGTLVLSL